MAQMEMLKKALKKVSGGTVQAHHIPEPKKSKSEKQMMPSPGPYRPTMWLDNKQFPGVAKWNAGDTVVLALTCKVASASRREAEGREPSAEASLEVMEIADLSMHGGKGQGHEGMKMLPPGMSATTCPDCKKMVKLADSRIKPGHRVGSCPECGKMFASPKEGK